MVRFLLIAISTFILAAVGNAQTAANTVSKKTASNQAVSQIKTTPAYAELLLRKTELESALEDFSEAYTDDYPKVRETRYQLSLIEKDLARLLAFGNSDLTRMTLALGKLMVWRAELEADLWSLKTRFGNDHPDVRRAARRVSSFEKAIAEILP